MVSHVQVLLDVDDALHAFQTTLPKQEWSANGRLRQYGRDRTYGCHHVRDMHLGCLVVFLLDSVLLRLNRREPLAVGSFVRLFVTARGGF